MESLEQAQRNIKIGVTIIFLFVSKINPRKGVKI